MTTEIARMNWKKFFDGLSRDLFDWETTVEVVSDDVGAQVMSASLPFGGLTFDVPGNSIELEVGRGTGNHQSHIIFDPVSVAFNESGTGPGGVLDVEDAAGTKTLIHFIRPFPVLMEYEKTEIVAVA